MNILQVNKSDINGGAANIAMNLLQAYRVRNHNCWLAVGYKRGNDPNVFQISNDEYRNPWARALLTVINTLIKRNGQSPIIASDQHLLPWISKPQAWVKYLRGHEYFAFPGTRHLLKMVPMLPDLLHCHNLHGGFFDLRTLPWLSKKVPVVLNLHDAWLLGGHCAHSFDCKRWRTGCGSCPDLTILPSIRRDGAAYNWRQKQLIFSKSRFYVTTPSRWLMEMVEQSMLVRGMVQGRVIPNGVDLSVFHPVNKHFIRDKLGIPRDVPVLLTSGKTPRTNIWKDYQTMQSAAALVAQRLRKKIIFVVLGETAPTERIGQAEVRFIPFQKEPTHLAQYYQLADVYIHAAKADTFPNAILEAMACGIPVVATAVGGITEQINDGRTGFLTPPENATEVARYVDLLLKNDGLYAQMGIQAAHSVRRRFDRECQADDLLSWYAEIIENDRRAKKDA